jgi:hypothetical protein
MVKRVMIFAVLAGSVSMVGSAQAGCPAASAGHRGGATVPAERVIGVDESGAPIVDPNDAVTVTLDARWADVCDDGTVPTGETVILGAPTTLTITGSDDDHSCTAETTSDWDPFGFAVGVHDDLANTQCTIDITWSGFTGVYAPDAARSGAAGSSAQVVVSKATNHENGVVYVNGLLYRAHGLGIGVMWSGVGGQM